MKFSIGYQLPDEYDSIPAICQDYSEKISNVYFSWGALPSGRSPLFLDSEEKEMVQFQQLQDLRKISEMGISLTLLLNANCYGEKALSIELLEQTIGLIRYLKEQVNISQITTTSPFLAESIRKKFGKKILLNASVNMRIGTLHAMQQLLSYFDGFYLQKEFNRNLSAIEHLSGWCRERGKTLHILANSGCLPYCGFQTFHDNLVAHEAELLQQENLPSGFPSPCWKYLHSLSAQEALTAVLQANWIRPEEVSQYETFFSEMKLATRMHSRPRMVIAAYIRGHFPGNIMDLTEPSYTSLFRGAVLDNTLFPADWSYRATHCAKQCDTCDYCHKVAQQAAVQTF